MENFTAKTICILGRQPALGLAELESLYGAGHIQPSSGVAFMDVDATAISFRRLGGTVKVARVLDQIPGTSWAVIEKYLMANVPAHIQHTPPGKFTLGISFYGLPAKAADINRLALSIKKASKKPMRVVPNRLPTLNSAQVLHNKLTSLGAWELLLVRRGQQAVLAQTLFVQDIEAYAARDQARPKRDARVGMLPPKLAQIIINLASSPQEKARVLDPFCGTGVILQEAMLMGFAALGSDIEPRMVKYSKANLEWLSRKFTIEHPEFELLQGDATNTTWPHFEMVASEIYLGRPLSSLPDRVKLENIVQDVNTITAKFLNNLAGQMKNGQRACLAVPAWRNPNGNFTHLPILDKLTDMGYNYLDLKHTRREQLVYFRENQIVARQLIRLQRK